MGDSELFKIDDLEDKVVKLDITEINNNPDEEFFDIVKFGYQGPGHFCDILKRPQTFFCIKNIGPHGPGHFFDILSRPLTF